MRYLFNSRSGDFITAVDENSIIVVKELAPQDGYAEMEKIAEMILDSLGEEKKADALIAYGTIVGEIKEVSRSYKGSAHGIKCRQDFLCRSVL